jgi:integrase
MAKINLTAGRVRDFTATDKKQSFLWDSAAPGLGVRATAGATAYIFQGRLAAQVVRITIGDVRAWTLEQARGETRRLQTLLDQGIDPRQDKAEKIAQVEEKRQEKARHDVTVGEAWSAYVESRRHKWGARHLAAHADMVKTGGELRKRGKRPGESSTIQPGVLVPLLPLKLSDLDNNRVRAWLKPEVERRPTYAALAFRLLRAFVRWCADQEAYQGITQVDACASRVGKDTLKKAGVKDDCLQREQLPAWFAVVRAIGNPVISAYLQSLLLVGSRREELAGLKWEDVDFQWKAITIKDKVEGERTIPLTPYVASLLAGLPRRNEFVFSSPTAASGRIQEPRIAHKKALSTTGIDDMTLHGLRRSFGTLSEWCEVPVGVVAQIQGHKPSAIAEKHYRRRPLDLLRQWHEKIEAWILEQAGVTFQAAEQPGALRAVK